VVQSKKLSNVSSKKRLRRCFGRSFVRIFSCFLAHSHLTARGFLELSFLGFLLSRAMAAAASAREVVLLGRKLIYGDAEDLSTMIVDQLIVDLQEEVDREDEDPQEPASDLLSLPNDIQSPRFFATESATWTNF
jgi:hypothetical protein